MDDMKKNYDNIYYNWNYWFCNNNRCDNSCDYDFWYGTRSIKWI